MINYIMLITSAFCGSFGTLFKKIWQNKTTGVDYAVYVYMIITTVFACTGYYAMSGFDISVNAVTLRYSILYAIISCASVLMTFTAMNNMNIILYSVFSKCSIAIVWLYGIFVMNDRISYSGVVSAILIIISVILPALEKKRGKIRYKEYLIGIVVAFIASCSTIIIKIYGDEANRMGNAVLCFWTNVFFFIFMVLFTFISLRIRKEDVKSYVKDFKRVRKYLYLIAFDTVFGTISSLMSLYVIQKIPISIYCVLNAALTSVATFVVSKVILSEKCTRYEVISFCVASVSGVIALL